MFHVFSWTTLNLEWVPCIITQQQVSSLMPGSVWSLRLQNSVYSTETDHKLSSDSIHSSLNLNLSYFYEFKKNTKIGETHECCLHLFAIVFQGRGPSIPSQLRSGSFLGEKWKIERVGVNNGSLPGTTCHTVCNM